MDGVKQHDRLNDNHLGRLVGDDCRWLMVHVAAVDGGEWSANAAIFCNSGVMHHRGAISRSATRFMCGPRSFGTCCLARVFGFLLLVVALNLLLASGLFAAIALHLVQFEDGRVVN